MTMPCVYAWRLSARCGRAADLIYYLLFQSIYQVTPQSLPEADLLERKSPPCLPIPATPLTLKNQVAAILPAAATGTEGPVRGLSISQLKTSLKKATSRTP